MASASPSTASRNVGDGGYSPSKPKNNIAARSSSEHRIAAATPKYETTFGATDHQSVTTTKSMNEIWSGRTGKPYQRSSSTSHGHWLYNSVEGSSGSGDTHDEQEKTLSSGIEPLRFAGMTTNVSVVSIGSIKSVKTDEDLDEVIVFVEEPSKKLCCMLCNHVFKDPVITLCGHTFCRSCAVTRQHDKCPIDDCPLSVVVSNIAISDQIGELQVYCKYGCRPSSSVGEYVRDPNGCPFKIKLNQKRDHESHCQYAPTRCPNSSSCPALIKRNLEAHLDVCEHTPCVHRRYGCKFKATRELVREHLRSCRYETVKDFLGDTESQIVALRTKLQERENEVNSLRATVGSLSDRLGLLEQSCSIRLERLEDKQGKVSCDVLDMRHSLSYMGNELQQIQSQMGTVRTMDQHLWKCKGTFVGHEGPVWTLCVYGELLFSGSSDKTIKVWDIQTTYKCMRTLEGHSGIVLALCVHGKRLYSGSADNSIKVWKLGNLECEHTIQAHENPVCTLATSSNLLFSGSLKTIKVWDMHNHQMVHEMTGQNHWVRALVATQDYLYSGSYQSVKIWNMETFECVNVVNVSGGSVYSIAVTDQHLITGTYENQIHVWDVNTFKPLATLSGHVGTVYALVAIPYAATQMQLFSASYDRTLRVWNLETMGCVQTLIRHQGSVACLTSARGRVYSGAVDSAVKVWQ
ncbi:E3 ubiquitin-protein ligase TRAF7-like [Corticium candelabrum]|uniref:E3 ubiquitin-protein ligase TRAF7-like n=1 Tax=Corticium candelabrum TaxID=121492 RepID=UPI002E32A231|nr:E3 ubiquitin-protein ligase TRAF7-like [Corticium candelabrum]